jgi:N-methylhydantoinase A
MLGGAVQLDKKLAEKALRALAQKVKVDDIHRLAEGVVKVCINNMAGAMKTVSIERGFDPRDFYLVPMGGAGAMHAIPIAEERAHMRIGLTVIMIAAVLLSN